MLTLESVAKTPLQESKANRLKSCSSSVRVNKQKKGETIMKRRNEFHKLPAMVMSAIVVGVIAVDQPVVAQISLEREPINYYSGEVNDPVAKLQKQIDAGAVELKFDERHGYLKSVLNAFDISTSSQMLVFSKTSVQLRRISPWSPRALYFNDNSYVGWVPNGTVIEVSSVDPQQGAIFYTLLQEESGRPKFVRDRGNCLACHASSRTQGVPGHLVRSVYSSASGQPHYGSGTFRTNHASPLKRRWGGWYVTGTHGRQRHMGNVISRESDRPENLDVEAGANVTDLSELTRTNLYLTSHSDIVALMVLEHQTDMHNFITLANYETRLALHQCAVMNRAFKRPDDFMSDSTQRRISSGSDKLLKYMLFAEEYSLTDKIEGTSDFAKNFAALGPKDTQGRSLREFDLQRRIFKYPCSYLIYSEAFRALPPQVKDNIYQRLWEILTGKDRSETFSHLSLDDRRAIFEILRDTNSDLPEYWKVAE